ncbi:MAG: hypothetical protein RBR49_12095 [Desulfovibrio desulfuricans]|nr:hypothetical protein [Desulfovibrio desulfuricans]
MISDTTTSIRYVVTDGVLSYGIPFRIYAPADVAVFWSVDARADTELTLGTHYTVTILTEGGMVNLLPGVVPVGAVLAVVSNIPATQEADFSSTSTVNTAALETQLDRQVQMIQQLEDSVARSVVLPVTSSETPQDVVRAVYAARDDAQTANSEAQAAMNTAANSAAAAAENAARAFSQADRAKTEADRAQNLANIGPATQEKFGMVKIGEGIDVEEDGTISVPPPPEINLATNATAGTVIVGEGLDITGIVEEGQENPPTPGILSLTTHASEDGEKYGRGDFQFFGHVRLTDDFEEIASASEGIGLSPAGAKAMYDKLLGLEGTTTITSSRDFVAPEAATYRVTVVGGGGSGGSGGSAYAWTVQVSETRYDHNRYSGGGGGGGGAGETLVMDVTLAKGESVPVIVGGPGGNSSFGSYVVSRGGGHGGNGGSGSKTSGIPNGGGGGTSYGSAAGSGGSGKHSTSTSSGLSGGSGGAGGRSTHGQYGHGGNGGSGGGINSNGTYYGPSGGASGTQGVVIVALNLGG